MTERFNAASSTLLAGQFPDKLPSTDWQQTAIPDGLKRFVQHDRSRQAPPYIKVYALADRLLTLFQSELFPVQNR